MGSGSEGVTITNVLMSYHRIGLLVVTILSGFCKEVKIYGSKHTHTPPPPHKSSYIKIMDTSESTDDCVSRTFCQTPVIAEQEQNVRQFCINSFGHSLPWDFLYRNNMTTVISRRLIKFHMLLDKSTRKTRIIVLVIHRQDVPHSDLLLDQC